MRLSSCGSIGQPTWQILPRCCVVAANPVVIWRGLDTNVSQTLEAQLCKFSQASPDARNSPYTTAELKTQFWTIYRLACKCIYNRSVHTTLEIRKAGQGSAWDRLSHSKRDCLILGPVCLHMRCWLWADCQVLEVLRTDNKALVRLACRNNFHGQEQFKQMITCSSWKIRWSEVCWPQRVFGKPLQTFNVHF